MQKRLLEKLVFAHLFNKFPTFHGSRNFITLFYKSPPLVHILSQINPVRALSFYFLTSILLLLSRLTPRSSNHCVEWPQDSQFQVYFILNSDASFHSWEWPAAICNPTWHRPAFIIKNVFFFWKTRIYSSNKSRTRSNSFSVYFSDVCLQLNMFRTFFRPSSGAQWLQWQPMVLPSYRGDSRVFFVVGPAGPPDHEHNTTITTIRR
jgi:hypothetical protein